MKMAFFLAHYPSPGGTTKAVGGLAYALSRLGQEVYILCLGDKTSEWQEDTIFVQCFHKGAFPRSVPRDLLAFLGSERFDLVLLNGMFMPELTMLAWWLDRIGTPFVVCPHGPYHPELLRKNWLLKWLYRPIERYVLEKAKAVQVLSSSHVPLLRRYGVKTPAFAVPNGFDPTEIEGVELDKSTSMPGKEKDRWITLFSFGRIDAHTKGLNLCIEAISILEKRFQDTIRLIIQGPDWGDKNSLTRLAKARGVSHLVSFLPPDYAQSPISLIAKYDCLVLPSRYDGFGFVVLEAMLAKRPVIVSSQAGSAEHVMNARCGIVVEPEPRSIAAGIEEMFERKSEWEDMGNRGYLYAFEHLTWDKIAIKALENYKQLCGMQG